MTPAGYSGTPLAKKLGIKPGATLYLQNPPDNYRALVAPLPDDVKLVTRPQAELDLVHLFTTRRADLAKSLAAALKTIKQDGAIWVSWPKQAARVPTDVTEDVIRAVALPLGLVDIKVCAVDETWSGLKLVIRRARRNSP